jgi:2-phospho-L-lactate guanylyltransferase
MTTWAVIPVKQLRESKRRLAHILSPEDRAGLIYRFLDDLLAVLNRAEGIDRVLVVTADPAVRELAGHYAAEVIDERYPAGLNAAVALGVDYAARHGATAVLILPADLPFARVEDIEGMIRPLTADRRPLTQRQSLSPDHRPLLAITGDETEQGTNALLLAPPRAFTFRYGPGSFQAHLAQATAGGRTVHIINAPGLRFDLDTESDWLVYNGYLVMVADE